MVYMLILGVSLSALSKSVVLVNPDIPEAKKLRSWYVIVRKLLSITPLSSLLIMIVNYNFVYRYDSEGKESSLASVSSGMSPSRSGSRSMYSDRVLLSHITKNPSLGDDKVFYHELSL